MTLSDLERRNARGQFFQADLRNNAHTVRHRTTRFSRIKYMGSSVFMWVSHAPATRGRCPSAPQFWRFLSIYAHILWRRITKFDVVTHIGRGLVLGVSHAPPQQGGARALPQFLRFLLFVSTPFVAELTNLTWCYRWGGTCILGSATPPAQESGVSRLPNSGVYVYLCLHPLTQNDQMRHGNI